MRNFASYVESKRGATEAERYINEFLGGWFGKPTTPQVAPANKSSVPPAAQQGPQALSNRGYDKYEKNVDHAKNIVNYLRDGVKHIVLQLGNDPAYQGNKAKQFIGDIQKDLDNYISQQLLAKMRVRNVDGGSVGVAGGAMPRRTHPEQGGY